MVKLKMLLQPKNLISGLWSIKRAIIGIIYVTVNAIYSNLKRAYHKKRQMKEGSTEVFWSKENFFIKQKERDKALLLNICMALLI